MLYEENYWTARKGTCLDSSAKEHFPKKRIRVSLQNVEYVEIHERHDSNLETKSSKTIIPCSFCFISRPPFGATPTLRRNYSRICSIGNFP